MIEESADCCPRFLVLLWCRVGVFPVHALLRAKLPVTRSSGYVFCSHCNSRFDNEIDFFRRAHSPSCCTVSLARLEDEFLFAAWSQQVCPSIFPVLRTHRRAPVQEVYDLWAHLPLQARVPRGHFLVYASGVCAE